MLKIMIMLDSQGHLKCAETRKVGEPRQSSSSLTLASVFSGHTVRDSFWLCVFGGRQGGGGVGRREDALISTKRSESAVNRISKKTTIHLK